MNSAVVILNWNGQDLLSKFLPSVVKYTPELASIYVADNGSTDDSISRVRRDFPRVKVIENGANIGFAGGYNQALKKVDEEYVVLLNSDVEVTKGWLEPLIKRLSQSPKTAACQPKILSYSEKNKFEYAGACGGMIDKLGYPFCRGRIFDHTEIDSGQYNNPIEIFWATGTCLAIKKSAYFEVGGLDSSFFAHMEEIDLCWRLHRAGYSVWVEPDSEIYHIGGGTLPALNPKKTYLNFTNGLAMITKNSRISKLLWLIPVRLVLDGIAGLKFLLDGLPKHTWAIARAHLNFYFKIFQWLGKRNGKYSRLPIISQSSVVWSFFVKKQKTFRDLT